MKRATILSLVAVIVAGGACVAAAIEGGCAPPQLPPEPPFIETVSALARDH